MMGIVFQVLDRFFSYHVTLLPTLFVYGIESTVSLEIWRAVQRIPLPEMGTTSQDDVRIRQMRARENAEKEERRKERNNTLLLVYLGLVVATGRALRLEVPVSLQAYITFSGPIMSPESAGWIELYYFVTLLVPCVLVLSKAIELLSGNVSRTLFRKADGKPAIFYTRSDGYSVKKSLISILAALIISVAALAFGNPICVGVVYASLLRLFVSWMSTPGGVSLRKILIGDAGMGITLVAFITALSFIDDPFPWQVVEEDDTVKVDWAFLLVSAIFSSITFHTVSTLYRFGYAQSYPTLALPEVPEATEPESKPMTDLGVVVVYPKRGEHKFSQIYFNASIFAIILSYAIFAAISTWGPLIISYENSGYFLMYVSPGVVFLAVCTLAVPKGEMSKLWAYSEQWIAKTERGTAKAGLHSSEENLYLLEKSLSIVDQCL